MRGQIPVMKILRLVDKGLARAEGWLLVFFLGLMVVLTFSQVLFRALYFRAHVQWANTIMGHVDWAEPMVRLLVLWVTFLGASLLTRDHKHIKIDLMSDFLPTRWQPICELFLSAACALVMGLMFKASVIYVKTEITLGGQLFLGLPTWAGQLMLPAGFLILLFRFFVRGIEQAIELIVWVKT